MVETIVDPLRRVQEPRQNSIPASIVESDGATSISLTASATERILSIAFLLIWLAAWLAGEAIVLAMLLSKPTLVAPLPEAFHRVAESRFPPLILLFLLAWFVFWTISGIAGCSSLIRKVAGRDVIELRASEVACWNSIAFGGFERVYGRGQITSVFLRAGDQALTIHTADGRQRVLTKFGTQEERLWLEREIRSRYLPEVAATSPFDGIDTSALVQWEFEARDDGLFIRNSLKSRVTMNALATFVVLLVEVFAVMPMVAGVIDGIPGTITVGRVFIAIGAGVILFHAYRSREWWIVRENYLFHGVTFAKWKKEDQFTNARLSIDSSQHKDGTHYRLTCSDGNGQAARSTRLASARDLYTVRAFADVVGKVTGWRVE